MTRAEKQIFVSLVNLMFMMKRIDKTKTEIRFEGVKIKFEYEEVKDDKQGKVQRGLRF